MIINKVRVGLPITWWTAIWTNASTVKSFKFIPKEFLEVFLNSIKVKMSKISVPSFRLKFYEWIRINFSFIFIFLEQKNFSLKVLYLTKENFVSLCLPFVWFFYQTIINSNKQKRLMVTSWKYCLKVGYKWLIERTQNFVIRKLIFLNILEHSYLLIVKWAHTSHVVKRLHFLLLGYSKLSRE